MDPDDEPMTPEQIAWVRDQRITEEDPCAVVAFLLLASRFGD
jgi:hypothetical protein